MRLSAGILALLLGCALVAQQTVTTKITIQSIVPNTAPGVFAVVMDAAGVPQVKVVPLGTGVSLDPATGALMVQSMRQKYDVRPVRQTNGSWKLPDVPLGGAIALHLNGLYMTRGLDYTLAGDTITFAPGQTAGLVDTAIVNASYQY